MTDPAVESSGGGAMSVVGRDPRAGGATWIEAICKGRKPEWPEECAESTEVFCARLTHGRRSVRLAAASSLARVGDARALEPLALAIWNWDIGMPGEYRRAERSSLVGTVGLVGFWVLLIIWTASHGTRDVVRTCLAVVLLNGVILHFWQFLWRRRRRRDSAAFIEAFVQVALRHPEADLSSLAPKLPEMARDRLMQPATTRAAAEKAVRQLGAAVHTPATLPVPATAPALRVDALPVAAASPAPAGASGPSAEEGGQPT